MNGILIDDDYEIEITPVMENGLIVSGLVVGNIDYQRCKIIMEAAKGEIKEYPTLGFGIDRYLKSPLINKKQQFITELEKELKSDGITTAKVTVGDDLSQLEITL